MVRLSGLTVHSTRRVSNRKWLSEMSLAFRRLMERELISSQCKRLVGKLNLMESCYRKRMKSRFPWLGSGCLELNWIEKIEAEARISEMKCQDWLEMSAVGKGGEETLYTHMCYPFSKRKLSGKNRTGGTDTACPGGENESDKIHPDSRLLQKKFWPRHWHPPEKASLSILHCFLKEWAKGTV